MVMLNGNTPPEPRIIEELYQTAMFKTRSGLDDGQRAKIEMARKSLVGLYLFNKDPKSFVGTEIEAITDAIAEMYIEFGVAEDFIDTITVEKPKPSAQDLAYEDKEAAISAVNSKIPTKRNYTGWAKV